MKKTTQSSKKIETASGTGNQKAQEASVKKAMSNEDLATLTMECVTNLNAAAEKEMFAWVALGQLVNTYVENVRTGGFKGNPFKRLAEHESSVHREGQLRNYHGCSRLFNELGGENSAPKTSMTNYIAVMGSRLGMNEKRRLLNEAVEKNLSVSQLKDLVKVSGSSQRGQNGGDSNPESVAWRLSRFTHYGKSAYGQLVTMNGKAEKENVQVPAPIAAAVRGTLVELIRFAIEHQFLSAADIPLPKTTHPKEDGKQILNAA